jgi:hypothetical protein
MNPLLSFWLISQTFYDQLFCQHTTVLDRFQDIGSRLWNATSYCVQMLGFAINLTVEKVCYVLRKNEKVC